MKTIDFKDKKILITGGTSGLGRELAIQLSQLGAKVAIVARTQTNIDQLTKELPEIIGIPGDVSKKEQIHPIAAQVSSQLGDLDLLFNVASELGPTPLRLLVDTECEDFESVLQTNLLGPFRLTKALLPGMVLQGRGVVVNISSDAAIQAYPTWGSYGVSKAALDHLSRVFHEELKEQGVQFLALDPGDMNTPMHFAAVPGADPKSLREPKDSALKIIELINNNDFSQVRRAI